MDGSCCCNQGCFEQEVEKLLEFCTNESESDDAASREEDGAVVHYLPGQEAALHRPMRLLVASMNAGNEVIALAGDGWIPRGGLLKESLESPPSLSQQDLGNSPGIYDIIVVGIQEAVLGAKDAVQQGGSIRHHHEQLVD
ncbi:5PTASE14 [Symbiodinium microadriaticum]|nr:5PTASE14 [Symbiodinium microadriaticum]